MGRFNWIWLAPCALSVISFATLIPATAHAFYPAPGWSTKQDIRPPLGTCNVYHYEHGDQRVAWIRLQDTSAGLDAWAGGGYALGDSIITGLREITPEDIADCIDTDPSNIKTFMADGPDGSYEEDNYIGFKFTVGVNTTTGFVTGETYEYFVGSGEFPVSNTPATAHAGPDQTVASAASVTLDGSGSDANDVDQSLGYVWMQTSGTEVSLTTPTTAGPTFTAPTLAIGVIEETLVFSLTVNDGIADSVADTVSITVRDMTPPDAATAITITTNPDGSITVAGMAEPGATVRVTFPDGTVSTFITSKPSELFKGRFSRNKQDTSSKPADDDGAFSVTSPPAQPSGDVQIVVTDAAGNSSETSKTGFVAGPTVEQTQELIAGYMQNRASQTIAAQPDLIGFLSGASTGSFNADVTQSNGTFDFATSGDQPVWATLQGSWSEFGTTESSYFFGAVGAHTNISPDALVGIMFQFDRLTQTDGATSVEGDGYLVGPYFVAKLPNQPLFVEGRLLTGQTENQVSVVGVGGTATETFDTQRTFASIKVAGQLNYGELALTPSLTATHLRDEQDAFENTQGNTVAAQGIEVNSVAAGLNFAQAVSLSNGELMLTGGISGIWSSSEGTEFASSAAPTTDGQRARITLGASHTLPNGVVLSAGTFYDGIGLNDYESYGLDLGIQMQF
jgi:hypothetical protein